MYDIVIKGDFDRCEGDTSKLAEHINKYIINDNKYSDILIPPLS